MMIPFFWPVWFLLTEAFFLGREIVQVSNLSYKYNKQRSSSYSRVACNELRMCSLYRLLKNSNDCGMYVIMKVVSYLLEHKIHTARSSSVVKYTTNEQALKRQRSQAHGGPLTGSQWEEAHTATWNCFRTLSEDGLARSPQLAGPSR